MLIEKGNYIVINAYHKYWLRKLYRTRALVKDMKKEII